MKNGMDCYVITQFHKEHWKGLIDEIFNDKKI
jgi:hypothetical protein